MIKDRRETQKAGISLSGEEEAEASYDKGLQSHSNNDKAECGPEYSNHVLQIREML